MKTILNLLSITATAAIAMVSISPSLARRGPGNMGGSSVSGAYICTRDANGRLNLHASAANNAKVVAQVRNGRAIQSIDGDRGSDGFYWHKVYYGNTIGWARGDYLCGEGGE
ncbi:MAG: SH3 domain-containing protein [Hydrococcus sp. RM1_1_31]|nr:SH3 domain-containing protein [Hydrococcus sp. RM1_1_31]